MAKLSEYKRKRDFKRTAEPAGAVHRARADGALRFVIQKHAASHLHYDFRLELDGVMKSWAVPKGPSVDPSVKRLAMEVEDHPIEYNTFEGTIPQGEYGGGTVMLWDRGFYTADEAGADDDVSKVLRREYKAGKMSITLAGERLQGSWALVRTDPGPKPKWLLIKHRDAYARRYEATEEFTTSVVTDRTMDEIAGGRRVWHSNRAPARKAVPKRAGRPAPSSSAHAAVLPMRPASARSLPDDDRVFLPWRGGERVLVYATAESCAFTDASGKETTSRHTETAEAIARFAKRVGSSFILDAEFDEADILHVNDVLFVDGKALLKEAWSERRARLEALFKGRRVKGVLVERTVSDGERLLQKAETSGWRGILAIDPESPYEPGRRSRGMIAVPA